MSRDIEPDRCGNCASFRNDPQFLEATFPGLSSLSSGDASVRADDGLCVRHDHFVGARGWCAAFVSIANGE